MAGWEDRRQVFQTGLDCTVETNPVCLSDHSSHKTDRLPRDSLQDQNLGIVEKRGK